jgi:ubiquinone/menaquinone biosynthesis C-methylase UbiE
MITEERLSEVISKDVGLWLVEPHICSVYPNDEKMSSYDKLFGAFYDFVACNRFYNRLVWGYRTDDYTALCHNALTSSTDGWVLDAGCGSLAFSARAYVNDTRRPVVLLDQSLRLLRIAKSRLIKLNGHVPENMIFVHGDALQLPFRPKIFKTVISLNLLHVLEDIKGILQEIRNVLSDGGTISLTTLIESNRFADKYLHMWGKTGEVVPRNANQLFAVFEMLGMPVKYRIKGNMAFISYNI